MAFPQTRRNRRPIQEEHILMNIEPTAKQKSIYNDRRTSRIYRILLIPLIGLFAIYGLFSILKDSKMLSINNSYSVRTRTEKQIKLNTPNNCLGLGFEEEMDTLLSKYPQVLIIMPAKAAGTTMKEFTHQCMESTNTLSYTKTDNILAHYKIPDEAYNGQLKLPSLITSHQSNPKFVCNVMKHATKQTLVIYIHREETSRLASAIREVVGNTNQKTCDETHCEIKQETINKFISSKDATNNEIYIGTNQILTCGTYDCIKDNRPNLVFLHYKQASRLQKLLAKHHCPSVQTEVKQNTGAAKRPIEVVLTHTQTDGWSTSSTTTNVDLDQYIHAKIQHMEDFFKMKENASCVGTTRDLEDDLFLCPDEALHISGRTMDHQRLPFPF